MRTFLDLPTGVKRGSRGHPNSNQSGESEEPASTSESVTQERPPVVLPGETPSATIAHPSSPATLPPVPVSSMSESRGAEVEPLAFPSTPPPSLPVALPSAPPPSLPVALPSAPPLSLPAEGQDLMEEGENATPAPESGEETGVKEPGHRGATVDAEQTERKSPVSPCSRGADCSDETDPKTPLLGLSADRGRDGTILPSGDTNRKTLFHGDSEETEVKVIGPHGCGEDLPAGDSERTSLILDSWPTLTTAGDSEDVVDLRQKVLHRKVKNGAIMS